MYTINVLAKQFNLSRSTLLYYDSIGLLIPAKRDKNNYRLYSEQDKNKLEKICMYCEMGVPLKEIKLLINRRDKSSARILENQLIRLSKKIRDLKKQQHAIMNLLQNDKIMRKVGMMDRDSWKKILRSTGLTDNDMDRWHAEFERISPEAHHDFLVSLGIPENEIKRIRMN